uniref:Uncharacterized protein n=1 Tax=Biomphalaria glabrata TaxID=6526 RepID=A0A2C9M7W1_BIOGL
MLNAYTFLYMSSMCNPIIYAFRSAAFREGYKEILCQQANYVTDEEANNKQRTSRLMSIIAILRRGSVPANQNVIHKNGDIIITRGDRIVCVRKASSSRHPEDNVAPIPERLHGIQEDNQEEDRDGGSDDDNNVFHLLKANTERESLSDVSPRARGGSRYTRVNGANSCKSEKERSRSSASSMADSPKASKDRKGIAHDANLASAKSLVDSVVLDSDLRENIKLLDGQQNRNGSSQGIIEVGTTSAKKKTTSKQSDSIETSREQSGINTNLRRFISRSSEELPRPPTLVRLPSLEFLDPPISIFRPRSNTGSHEKLSMSKIKKNKEHSSEKQNAPPRKKRPFFDSASDVM